MTRGSARGKAAGFVLMVLVAATIVVYLVVVRSQPSPGTINLALARDGTAAEDVLRVWRAGGSDDDARNAVLLDFALIPLYAAAIGWGCTRARRVFRGQMLRAVGLPLAYAMPGVAALDVVENLGLLRMMSSGVSPAVHAITTTAAWIKFAVFFLAYAYAVVALATWIVRRVFESSVTRVPFLRRFEGQATVGQIDTPDSLERTDYHMPEPPWREGEWTPVRGERRIGICCSGGGVRSAAYNLGALQVLREQGIFDRARYLSAVSGGSYIAAAFAMTQAESDRDLIQQTPEFARGTPEEEYLRNRSSYLAPGLAGKARAALQAILGLTINLLFFWLVLFAVARPAGWLISSSVLHPELREAAPLRFAPTMLAPVALTAAMAIACALLPMLVRISRQATSDKILRAAAFLAVVSGLLLVALVALPWLTRAVPRWLRWLPDQRAAPAAAGGT
ncbi:MAG: patatin-like phospholipase family protein, partial [Actinomycetota bacterium]